MTRKRLTITLKKDLLEKLDKSVDGSKIRNRSHAIEYFLSKSLKSETSRVLILAGGAGLKLKPITDEIPKCLIKIQNKPLLEHTFDLLKKYNLTDIVIATGHLSNKVKQHFKDGLRFGFKITYIEDKKKSGTINPVLSVKNQFNNNPFIVIYSDVLTDIDYADLLEFHKSHNGVATMALASVEKPSVWGVVDMQGSKVVRFREKPQKKVTSHLINAGIYVFNASVFKYLNSNQKMLEQDLFPQLVKEGKLYGYPFRGGWYDVGSIKNYKQASKDWKGFKQK